MDSAVQPDHNKKGIGRIWIQNPEFMESSLYQQSCYITEAAANHEFQKYLELERFSAVTTVKPTQNRAFVVFFGL